MDRSRLQARHEEAAYRRVEVITGRRRRQNWSAVDKARIVAESFEPRANISEVARRNGVSRGVLTVWRRQAREAQVAPIEHTLFAAVRVTNDVDRQESGAIACAPKSAPAASGAIEVAIADATIHVSAGADGATLEAVIAALRRVR